MLPVLALRFLRTSQLRGPELWVTAISAESVWESVNVDRPLTDVGVDSKEE